VEHRNVISLECKTTPYRFSKIHFNTILSPASRSSGFPTKTLVSHIRATYHVHLILIDLIILIIFVSIVCMYVCIRGGLLQPLHLDPQWSIVLNPYDR
jgi:hypothetical protein